MAASARSDDAPLEQLAWELGAVVDELSLLGVIRPGAPSERALRNILRSLEVGDVDVARSLVRALNAGGLPPPRWWRTPLGILTAGALIGERRGVTRRYAAEALGLAGPGTIGVLLERGALDALDAAPPGGRAPGTTQIELGSVLLRLVSLEAHRGDAGQGE